MNSGHKKGEITTWRHRFPAAGLLPAVATLPQIENKISIDTHDIKPMVAVWSCRGCLMYPGRIARLPLRDDPFSSEQVYCPDIRDEMANFTNPSLFFKYPPSVARAVCHQSAAAISDCGIGTWAALTVHRAVKAISYNCLPIWNGCR